MTVFLASLGLLLVLAIAVALWVFLPRLTSALGVFGTLAYIANISGADNSIAYLVIIVCCFGVIYAVIEQCRMFTSDFKTFKNS